MTHPQMSELFECQIAATLVQDGFSTPGTRPYGAGAGAEIEAIDEGDGKKLIPVVIWGCLKIGHPKI